MGLDRDFERFRGGPTEAAQNRVHITINPQKLILLNRNAFHLLGKPDAVHLNFNRKGDVIAIEPASPRLTDSFPVVANNHNWRINTAPFCRHFGIDIDITLKFISPDFAGAILYLKLADTVSVGGRKRRKK